MADMVDIPEWLENGTEPNIANVAKKRHDNSNMNAHADVEAKKKIDDAISTDDPMDRLDKIQDVADALGD